MHEFSLSTALPTFLFSLQQEIISSTNNERSQAGMHLLVLVQRYFPADGPSGDSGPFGCTAQRLFLPDANLKNELSYTFAVPVP